MPGNEGQGVVSSVLHARISDALRREIRAGALKPHDRLPSERALIARFGVSRITVRQALASLQSEGLIFTLQGKGSFVTLPRKADHGLSSLLGLGEAMGVAGYEVHNEILGIVARPAPALVAARLGLAPAAAVTEIRRLRHVDRMPLSYEITYVPLAIGVPLARADLARRDIFAILEDDLGHPLGRADLAIEAAPADAEIAHRLRIVPTAPVLRIERLTHDAAGRPIDFEFLFYRGDAFRYRLTLERGRVHREMRSPLPGVGGVTPP